MKKLFVYIILVTALLAHMDWQVIHYAWWHNGVPPAIIGSVERWGTVKFIAALILCPPCAPPAENYYYALMEVEAGEQEQAAVLPVRYTHNPINPHGDWSFYWGQGGGKPWRRVSMLSLYLYWFPPTVLWWQFVKRFFR